MKRFICPPSLQAYICHLGERQRGKSGLSPRDIPRVFNAPFKVFSFPITSQQASKSHYGHLSLLYLFSTISSLHSGLSKHVSLGSTIAICTPCLADCQSIYHSSLEYPIIMSFPLWFFGSFLRASTSPVSSSLAIAYPSLLSIVTISRDALLA
jgi:hypothetical protein